MTQPAMPPRAAPTPGVVTAAAVVTLLSSAGSAGLILLNLTALTTLWAVTRSDFSGSGLLSLAPGLLVLSIAMLLLCAVAVLASLQLLRRRRWAWWALLLLSPVSAVLGVVVAGYYLPLAASAAAVAVVVLLFLPSTRAWLATDRELLAAG